MTISQKSQAHLKKIIKQIAGNIKSGHELYPEVVIAGDGYISCYSPLDRFFVKVRRGLAAYVVEEDVTEEKTLIYTIGGNLVEI